jgi:RNA ligase (TIGR02306 family)
VNPIPGADRIEVATLQGMDFQFVIQKAQFKPGDACLYFPVDALLPVPIQETLGLVGKLAGKQRNRIKTVKLRGQISQGIVAGTSLIPPEMLAKGDPAEITAHLGIEKYEPPELIAQDGKLLPLPDGLSVYDIEGADRFVEIAQQFFDRPVFITEKVEGSNFSVLAQPSGGEPLVNQRSKTIVPIEGVEHTFWKIARRQKIIDFAQSLAARLGKAVAVYGEALGPGIQSNIYGFKEHQALLFDIRVGHQWIAAAEFIAEVTAFYEKEGLPVPLVPVLSRDKTLREWLNEQAGKSLKEASNGTSLLAATAREGIVIRPMVEESLPEFGRLIIKQRSPEYLAKNEN